jgi:hypothetical protein
MYVRSSIGPFDVRSPPIKRHKVAGHLVPTLNNATRFFNVKRRRVAIEIISPQTIDAASKDHYDKASATPQKWDLENDVLNDHDNVVFRIFRLKRKNEREGEANNGRDGNRDDGDGRFHFLLLIPL